MLFPCSFVRSCLVLTLRVWVIIRFIGSRVANVSSYDTSKYRVSIEPSAKTGKLAYHLGEQITIKWQAPYSHSRKDWIGLYRVGRILMRFFLRRHIDLHTVLPLGWRK